MFQELRRFHPLSLNLLLSGYDNLNYDENSYSSRCKILSKNLKGLNNEMYEICPESSKGQNSMKPK